MRVTTLWDRVYKLNLSNINQSNCERDSLTLESNTVNDCVSKGKSEHFECRNHIRVIQPVGDGTRIYICGTNAHNPKDWVIYSNLTHLHRSEYVPGVGVGIAKCPYDPNDNSTAIWVERGNPGELPALYSGTNAEFTKADAVIFRTDLHNLTTGRREFSFKRTLKYDSKWLDKPQFVGSYDIGQHVLFFFRETAVEYINCGKNVYSRVARVCKRDTGGKNILNQNWATYLKARLNCSIPGEFPFYFNEIQSIYKVPGDNSKFYAVFTTSTTGLMGSAICAFTLDDIHRAFKGKFKEQATSSSAWLPVLSSRVPEPRPGECVNDTETLPAFHSSSSMGSIAMSLSLKGLLCTPEAHHKADQCTVPAVLQTTEKNQVLLGKFTILFQITKDGVPLSCYCRTVKEQVLNSFLLLVTHSTELILLKDIESVKMLPQMTMSHNKTHNPRSH
ncbi:Semaphorin-2A [Homalodisca vitripennis]|nr:Semaphorin-2A [Homalodisca vitripennis]